MSYNIIIVIFISTDSGEEVNNVANNSNDISSSESIDNNENNDASENKDVNKKKPTKIKAGTYKIGTDLPAEEYVFLATTGSLNSIISNDNVTGHTYITVNEGEYLKLRGGEAYAVSEAPSLTPKDGVYKDGTYIVGKDIPSGEYKVTVNSNMGMGYIEVSSDSRGVLNSIITNDNIMEDSYITVQDGQYLKLSGAEIRIN